MAEKEVTNVMEKVTPQTLPSEYTALGVKRGYNPILVEQLRMFIVGPSGEGKTTLLSGCPRTIILDFERGASGVPNARAFRVHIPTPTVFRNVVDKLIEDGPKPNRPFDRVAFDSIDEMIELLNPEFAAELRENTKFTGTDITDYGTRGAGYAILKDRCWAEIKKLETAGYVWTCIGHLTTKTITINNKERTVPRCVLFPTFASLINRNCDVFAAIYSQVEKEETTMMHQGHRIPGPPRDVVRVYMDATTINSEKNTGQGKLRGVPTMTTKILLPNPLTGKYGWDVFATEYNAAIEKVRSQVKSLVGKES